jgi:hypothetical protein
VGSGSSGSDESSLPQAVVASIIINDPAHNNVRFFIINT